MGCQRQMHLKTLALFVLIAAMLAAGCSQKSGTDNLSKSASPSGPPTRGFRGIGLSGGSQQRTDHA